MVYTRSKARTFRRAVVAGVGYAMKRRSTAYTQTRSQAAKKAKLTVRRRSRAQPPRPKRRNEMSTSNEEFSQISLKYGRKPGYGMAQVNKLVKANVSTSIFGLRSYSRFGGTSGSFPLWNCQAAAGTALNIPMYMFDLTSVPNDVGGTIMAPKTALRMYLADETPTCSHVAFVTNANTIDNLNIENVQYSSSLVDNYPGNASLLRWVQAKLMFYAPTTLPTKISIQIVRFKDQRLVPRHNVDTNLTDPFAIQWYQSFLKKYMISPLEVSNPQNDRYLNILHSHTFILNPKDTTEATNTNFREVDIFEWMNRKCTYQWEDKDLVNVTTTDKQTNIAQNATSVHPLARTYLIIRGQAGYVANNAGFNSTVHPSFDLVLRTAHQQIN